MQALRSLLAAAAMLASVGVASAADLLTEEQLNAVTAGQVAQPVVASAGAAVADASNILNNNFQFAAFFVD
jgi:hypothetical protein